jgi:hypothetical protein
MVRHRSLIHRNGERNDEKRGVPILEAKDTCQKGLKCVLGNGKKIKFWQEVWLGDCPLKIKFNKLYNIYNQQK